MDKPRSSYVLGDLYAIQKDAGIPFDTDEQQALVEAFRLGQVLMRDWCISRLGDYAANACAQVVAGIHIHPGFVPEESLATSDPISLSVKKGGCV